MRSMFVAFLICVGACSNSVQAVIDPGQSTVQTPPSATPRLWDNEFVGVLGTPDGGVSVVADMSSARDMSSRPDLLSSPDLYKCGTVVGQPCCPNHTCQNGNICSEENLCFEPIAKPGQQVISTVKT